MCQALYILAKLYALIIDRWVNFQWKAQRCQCHTGAWSYPPIVKVERESSVRTACVLHTASHHLSRLL